MRIWYSSDADTVLKELKTNGSGLSQHEAAARLQVYGHNKLKEALQKSRFSIFAGQFKDVMIVILLLAATISFVAGEYTDGFVILAIIAGNAIIGYIQEYNAEQSIRMLQKMAAQHALVLREGTHINIEASDLVPGDIILLEAGNIVPADARLLEANALKTDEAALTGESHSVDKRIATVTGEHLLPADQVNMVFKSTMVSNGSAKAVVVATGMSTEIGKIADLLQAEPLKTPLQKRLAVFSKQLAVIVVVICLLVFGYGLLRNEPPLKMFLTALSLAVAALPEALPAVITIALARGAARMVRQKALVRKLPAVETLGSVTYICSDKTGTLTENKMRVVNLQAAGGREELLLHALALNHEVKTNDHGELIGDSTEIAFVQYAAEKGYNIDSSHEGLPKEYILPFDSERMLMSTLHRHEGKWTLLVKGAPVKVGERVADTEDKKKWLDINRKWAEQGQRVLFFAYRQFDTRPEQHTAIEENLLMLGVVGVIDPPRVEVRDAIKECHSAGIRTVMITGDQPITAKAIASELGIIEGEDDEVLSGSDLKEMGEETLMSHVGNVRVYARVSPEQKLNIVQALQKAGEYVAMTGDGVNDAPSLKQANIGVAMGITGTDVSKEASHMILLDDNFATIVKAVREGRRIYDNIRKFVLYVLACNLGEILTIFFAPLLGFAMPLLPIHILWINLVTDGLPGLALAGERAEKNIMERPPRPPKENLFEGMKLRLVSTSLVLAAAALTAQWWAVTEGLDLAAQQTMVFTVLCFAQLGNAISVRSSYRPGLGRSLFSNPLLLASVVLTVLLQLGIVYSGSLRPVFRTVSLSLGAMGLICGVSVGAFVIIELIKLWVARTASAFS